jgi:hypothetical protein
LTIEITARSSTEPNSSALTRTAARPCPTVALFGIVVSNEALPFASVLAWRVTTAIPARSA